MFKIPARRSVCGMQKGGVAVLLYLSGLSFLSGCAPEAKSKLDLLQPQLIGRQQKILLASDRAYWSSAASMERLLVEFPLPGATTGHPTFLLYLRVPAGAVRPAVGTAVSEMQMNAAFTDQATGKISAEGTNGRSQEGMQSPGVGVPTTRPGQAVKGFFIQTRGDMAGLASIVEGQLERVGRYRPNDHERRFRVELELEDGSRLEGQILAYRDDWKLKQFEQVRHPADVEALQRP